MKRSLKFTSLIPLLVTVLIVVVAGCNNSSEPEKAPSAVAGPAPQTAPAANSSSRDPRMVELASGHLIFDKLLASAHLWALDAKPVTLQSQLRKENSATGRSCVWGLLVASESKKQTKIFDWSGIVAADAHAPGVHDSPPNTFDPKTANVKAGKEYSAAPGIQQSYRLKLDKDKKHLVWTVSYGTASNAITHME